MNGFSSKFLLDIDKSTVPKECMDIQIEADIWPEKTGEMA